MKTIKIRKIVFLPTTIIAVLFFIIYVFNQNSFDRVLKRINSFCTRQFGWMYLLIALFLVIISFIVLFSKAGKKRIGGESAEPMLSTGNWFNIVLCTTIAAGLIFWGSAEPLHHLMDPPEFLNIEPGSYQASVFSISSMLLHWTLTPYAIYCVPALAFAIAVYNQEKEFSFSSCLSGVIPQVGRPTSSAWIDSICVFCTVMGMVASLGQGILSVAGGLEKMTNVKPDTVLWTVIGLCMVITFVLSACSGVLKGIKWISNINVVFLLIMIALIFLLGPTTYIIQVAFESTGVYIDNFFTRSLMMGAGSNSDWSFYWTISTYANWAAWAPITGMFLGKIAYGHSIRKFILINLIASAVSSGVWVCIFGGTSIYMQTQGGIDLYESMQVHGSESVVYTMLEHLPLGKILIPLLVITVYLCFVTAADSTTNALGDLCCTVTKGENSLKSVKVIWGALIGIMAIILVCSNGIDGVKMISVIGGFPAMILLMIAGITLLKYVKECKNKRK